MLQYVKTAEHLRNFCVAQFKSGNENGPNKSDHFKNEAGDYFKKRKNKVSAYMK